MEAAGGCQPVRNRRRGKGLKERSTPYSNGTENSCVDRDMEMNDADERVLARVEGECQVRLGDDVDDVTMASAGGNRPTASESRKLGTGAEQPGAGGKEAPWVFGKLTVESQRKMESAPHSNKQAAAAGQAGQKYEIRRVLVPENRMPQLKKQWADVYSPLVKHMNLQVRMNVVRRMVELRPPADAVEMGNLQKGADFVRAFMLGFEVADAIALLRLDDLFVESFQVKDVKKLEGDHLARCIGRIAGKDGKTKYAIENATKTRIVVANTTINILGSFQNIKLARHSLCSLILGSPPGKVYNHLRTVSRRVRERL